MTDVGRNTHLARARSRLDPYLSPVWVAFFASIILSLIAIASHDTLNRDGMLYVDTARIFLQDGFAAALKSFPWPFFSVLIGLVSRATGIGLESTGHLLDVLFMAGTCALLVSCARRVLPQAAWMTGLVVLAIPGINEYRNELVREYGCWFFVMLALWLALRWDAHPRWRTALATQASLLAATLFRPEALVFFPALILWQFFAAPSNERWRRLQMIGTLPPLFLLIFFALILTGQITPNRLTSDFCRFTTLTGLILPSQIISNFCHIKLTLFDATSLAFSQILPDYAQSQARTILFFGSLAIIPVKLVSKLGLFTIPLLYPFLGARTVRKESLRSGIFFWSFIAYLLVLIVFVVGRQFLAGRYIVLCLLLATPWIGHGLGLMTLRFPRWKPAMLAISMLFALSNVVSISATSGKNHYKEAGQWLAQNVDQRQRQKTFIDSARTAYYAGWPYAAASPRLERDALPDAIARQEFDLVVLEIPQEDQTFRLWFGTLGLSEIRRFANDQGHTIIIAAPHPTTGRVN